MRTVALFSIAITLAAIIATYVRYESFDPCRWMEQDVASESGLPRLVVRARIKGQFLIDGVTNPDLGQCIMAWWKTRVDGMREES